MTTETTPPNSQHEDYEVDTLTNDRLLKDHEYDGIRELDNGPPSWFTYLFLGTIIFSLFYLYILFVFKPTGLVQLKEYEQEMASLLPETEAGEGETTAQPAAFELTLLTDETSLKRGQQTFNNICAACHLTDGGGLVGPNLTDKYWIHGNKLEDIFKIVTEGVIEKGMIPYRDQLSKQQRLEVSSYILANLYGTRPANPKAPQGEIYE